MAGGGVCGELDGAVVADDYASRRKSNGVRSVHRRRICPGSYCGVELSFLLEGIGRDATICSTKCMLKGGAAVGPLISLHSRVVER